MAETIDILSNKNQLKKEKISAPPLKSSTEILSELFRQFNAAPPEISLRLDSDKPERKSKKKKKHKEKKKKKTDKRGRSSSDDCADSDQEVTRKKSKKSKHKKHKKRSKSSDSDNGYVGKKKKRSYSPDSPLPNIILQTLCKSDTNERRVTSLDMGNFTIQVDNERSVKKPIVLPEDIPDIKPDIIALSNTIDHIPIPKTPDVSKIKLPDEFSTKSTDGNNKLSDSADKNKVGINKIQIKNLKFSSVFEANVKQAEEEARKKAEKYEDGELSSDSSSLDSMKVPTDVESEDDMPTSDLREKLNILARHNSESDTGTKVSKSDKSNKTKSSDGKSKESRSRTKKRSHSRSRSKSHRRSRSRSGSYSRSRRRSGSRTRHRHRRVSRHGHDDEKRTSRSDHRKPKDTESNRHGIDKKRLLEIARKNAITMLQNGALPAAVSLGPLAQQKVISAIKSGGKSVDELTDFCKNLSRQEALGELSSVSEDSDNSEINEAERPFHHPFLVKDKAPIVLNIKGGIALPTHTFQEKTMEQSKVLRLQFPVSSGSQHRGAEGEWRPVSPSALPPLPKHVPNPPLIKSSKPGTPGASGSPLAICAPPEPTTPPMVLGTIPGIMQPVIVPVIPPGPQVFPTETNTTPIDIGSIVSQRLTAIRKLQQNPNDVSAISQMYQVNKEMSKWAQSKQEPGQFTGSTGAQILTPRELASGYQAWVKRDQLQTAAPVSGGMGMHLLQKMGWKPGEGLGKEKNGSLTPLLLEIKLDTKGLVAKEERASNTQSKQRNPARRGGPATVKTLSGKHPVSLLGEFCSKRKFGVPSYTLCFECGPDHKKNFLFKVTVNGIEYQPNVASANKKQAKADAAQLCLQKLGLLPN